MSLTIVTIPLASITQAQAAQIGALLARVWVKPEKDAQFRARQLLDAGRGGDPRALLPPQSCVVYDGDQVVGHAMTEQRTIATAAGKLDVLALSKVCTDPDRRGMGIGPMVVHAAFAPVDSGVLAFSLFQTTCAVRPFYERLGARLVEQPITNSLATDPGACPFWDEVVMRYPWGGDWPAGPIDLLGPGY
ncbi:hypothetical protein Pla175_09950 [Pirellulimonas nuda]|uniref:N-acetyltransferase domain-containing protein n=1 Tax=Pirellulimonas nuda TaxID=2528009 RepID=A0A518D853_9BACT|nr:GNAT family N-acetyltransferase [Pirellulimonas nuda]QDU87630.1 hypothetical protein Pla175_09950 [Pirellulimonas nuda]